VLPQEVSVTLDRSTWTPGPVFDVVRRVGGLSQDDLEATLNCGVGMVALVPAEDVDRAAETLSGHGVDAWVAGEVALDDQDGGRVRLTGRHPGW
jgi:phosphoribosylformylglycinamidine cyclo-ligase